MIDPKEKNNNQGVKEVVVTRRDILKGFAATTIASLLTLFPELRGVEKANATTFCAIPQNGRNGSSSN